MGNDAGFVVVQPNNPDDSWDHEVDDDRIRSFIDQLIDGLVLDRDRVHFGGFSQGGAMTWRFVCDHSDLIASAAPIGAGATYPDDFPVPSISCDFDSTSLPAHEVDILYVHGRSDRDVPFETAVELRDAVVSAWEMSEANIVVDEPDYRWTQWTSPQGTVFEFLEHDWQGGFLGGHCYPGRTGKVGCGTDTPIAYGEAALQFYIDHPKDNAAATSTGSSATSTIAVAGVSIVEDVIYRESSDGVGSTVDVFVGDGNEGGPMVVLLHGFSASGPGRPDADLRSLGEEVAGLGSAVFYFGWETTFGFSAGSVTDLSCVGPFVAARASEFGADPDKVVVVGHSMGAEAGSMLALSSFDLPPSPDCTETGQVSNPVAFLGIGGSYGMVGGPLDDDHTRFRARSFPRATFKELDADEEVVHGLTAAQIYLLDGYSAIPPVAALDVVLLVGSEDQYSATNADITSAFAAALEASNTDVEAVTVEGANHEDVVDPTTEAGQATLQVMADILTNTP